MYHDQQSPISFYPILEQSLVDDARTAYEYGLSSTSSMAPSEDLSFIDQRASMQQPAKQAQVPSYQSWFGTPNQQHSFYNRTFSMPQQQSNLSSNNDLERIMEEQQQQQLASALLARQQQQNWVRQQQQQQQAIFPMQQHPQQFEQVSHIL